MGNWGGRPTGTEPRLAPAAAPMSLPDGRLLDKSLVFALRPQNLKAAGFLAEWEATRSTSSLTASNQRCHSTPFHRIPTVHRLSSTLQRLLLTHTLNSEDSRRLLSCSHTAQRCTQLRPPPLNNGRLYLQRLHVRPPIYGAGRCGVDFERLSHTNFRMPKPTTSRDVKCVVLSALRRSRCESLPRRARSRPAMKAPHHSRWSQNRRRAVATGGTKGPRQRQRQQSPPRPRRGRRRFPRPLKGRR